MGDKVLALPRKHSLELQRFVPSARSFAVGGALALGAVGLYLLARESSLFALQRVRVSGAGPAVAARVRHEAERWAGRSLVTVHGDDVVRRIEMLPTIRSATVDRAFPHTLRIRVVPERAVAVLRRGPGSWLVSARGRVVAPIAPRTHRTLPRIWLPATTEIDVGTFLGDESGVLAARSLAAFVGSGFPDRIAYVRALDGQITLGLRGGLQVRLGAPIDLPVKFAIADAIVPGLALPSQGGPDYLDITVPERPVAGRDSQLSG